MADGFESSAPHTSRVTSVAVLLPPMSGTAGITAKSATLHLRGRLANEIEIPHGWLRVELLEHAVRAAAPCECGDATLWIVQVTEHNRLRRADLLAGGQHCPVGDRLARASGFDLRLLDSLHAERALLHHAARADGDVWIE